MMLARVGNIYVSHDQRTVSWTSGMAIDGDGCPACYCAADSGLLALDHLANAGHPGSWWGLVTDEAGVPYVQKLGDPSPGYFISPTALQRKDRRVNDPTRYVDSSKVPYISVPPELRELGVRMGDVGRVSFEGVDVGTIVADVSPRGRLGEGSIALADALGIPSSPKDGGVIRGVSFCILLGSATMPAWPRNLDEIAAAKSIA